MPGLELGFSDDFIGNVNRLEGAEVKRVWDAVDQFRVDPDHPSLNFHPIHGDSSGRLHSGAGYSAVGGRRLCQCLRVPLERRVPTVKEYGGSASVRSVARTSEVDTARALSPLVEHWVSWPGTTT